jgi:hypothetical protein
VTQIRRSRKRSRGQKGRLYFSRRTITLNVLRIRRLITPNRNTSQALLRLSSIPPLCSQATRSSSWTQGSLGLATTQGPRTARTSRDHPHDTMWNNMPPELLGKIFGHLTVLDILRLKMVCWVAVPLLVNILTKSPMKVNRTFRNVISSEPRLQYECELAAAGFLDNPNAPGTIFDRRRSLRSYLEMKPVGKQSLPLGLTGFCYTPQRSGDVFVTYDPSRNTLHFCRPPSASGSRPTKTWSFPLNFDLQAGHFLIHFPLDLIVIAQNR